MMFSLCLEVPLKPYSEGGAKRKPEDGEKAADAESYVGRKAGSRSTCDRRHQLMYARDDVFRQALKYPEEGKKANDSAGVKSLSALTNALTLGSNYLVNVEQTAVGVHAEEVAPPRGYPGIDLFFSPSRPLRLGGSHALLLFSVLAGLCGMGVLTNLPASYNQPVARASNST